MHGGHICRKYADLYLIIHILDIFETNMDGWFILPNTRNDEFSDYISTRKFARVFCY